MKLEILEMYKKEIIKNYDHAVLTSNIKAIGDEAFFNSIIGMCIKYETLTADLEEQIFNREPKYNHPWSNTREISKKLRVNITKEYAIAHDAWDLYNTLKHVNDKTEVEQVKLFKKYKLNGIQEAAIFVRNALINLIDKLDNR